jgi:hypothetical protein
MSKKTKSNQNSNQNREVVEKGDTIGPKKGNRVAVEKGDTIGPKKGN